MIQTVGGKYVLLTQPPRCGGFSAVFKATDPNDGTLVAVKLVDRKKDPSHRLAVDRELESLRKLSHPNIIRLRDAGIDEQRDVHYLVLDWVDHSLADVLDKNGPYEWEELAEQIAAPLVKALSYAHLKEVEHRDIKPKNVLVAENGVPLLADFGIAKVAQSAVGDLTVGHFRSGPYTPPEGDGVVKYVRDVYSMGVLLIQALHRAKVATFADIGPALQAINVPPDVRKLLARCVDPDHSQRPDNGAFLADELENVLRGRAVLPNASKSTLWLQLSQAARRHLTEHGDGDPGSAEAVVLSDVNDEVFVEYRFDPTDRSTDRSTVFLVGKQWRFVLKLDKRPAVIVSSARALDYEDLERIRKFALNVTGFTKWVCAEPRNRLAADEGLRDLVRALDDHEEQKDVRRHGDVATGYDGLDILNEWNRVLQAREDLARGSFTSLRYTTRVIRGREVELTLRDEVEDDLLGTDWEIVDGDSRWVLAFGQVVGQEDDVLTLRSKGPVPGLPTSGVVRPHLGPAWKALQRQRDAVLAFRDGTAARPQLREKIQDPLQVTQPIPHKVTDWSKDLDDGKRRAVESALGAEDILLVEGPPGTGKTDLIAEIVLQSLKLRPSARILIVSQTHVAVDNALVRLEQADVPDIVRLGNPDDPRVDKHVRHLLLDQRMAKWSEGIRRSAQRHLEKVAATEGVDLRHLRAALAFKQVAKVIDERERVQREIERRMNASGSTTELVTSLEIVEDDSDLQERVNDLATLHEQLVADVAAHLAGDLTLSPNMTADEALTAADAIMGTSASITRLLALVELQAEWLQRTRSDQPLAEAFLSTARVIAGTCIGFIGQPAVRDLDIDLCILDEASKATATEALVPLARSRRAILVGDINQLPPQEEELLRSHEILEEHDIEKTLVEETLFKWFSGRLPDHSKFPLRDQYRMIAPIGDLVSTCFYNRTLNSPKSEGLRGHELLGKPVCWSDTSQLGEVRREIPGSGGISFANRTEVRLVFARLTTLENAIKRGVVSTPELGGKLDVLLIAPYRKQVDEMRRRLSSIKFKHLQVDVLSVDAVQGRQCDVAIFSVTRSNDKLRLGFLGPEHWRRINVAVSRARFGLTIVGDAEFCRSAGGALQDIIRYIEDHPEDCEVRVVDNA